MHKRRMLDERDADPDTPLSYLDQRLFSALGDVYKELGAGMTTTTLHSKYGYFGSFLPPYEWRQSALSRDKLITLAASNVHNERKYSIECSIERGRQEATSCFAGHTSKNFSTDLAHESPYGEEAKENPLSFADDILHQPIANARPKNNAIYSVFGLGDLSSSDDVDDDENDQQSDVDMECSSDKTPLTMIQIMTSHRPPNGLLLSPLKNLIVNPGLDKKSRSDVPSGERSDHGWRGKVDKSEEIHKGEIWRGAFVENVSKWKENTTDGKRAPKESVWSASKPSSRSLQVDECPVGLTKKAGGAPKMKGSPVKVEEKIVQDKPIRKFSVKMEPKVIEEKPTKNPPMKKEQRVVETTPPIMKEGRENEEKHAQTRKKEKLSEEKHVWMSKEEKISDEKHPQMRNEEREINSSIKNVERVTEGKHGKSSVKGEESAVGGRPKALKAYAPNKSVIDLPKDGAKESAVAKYAKEGSGSLIRHDAKEDLVSMPKTRKEDLTSMPKSRKEVSSMHKTSKGREDLDSVPRRMNEDFGTKPKAAKVDLGSMSKYAREGMPKYVKEDIGFMPIPGKEDSGLMQRVDLNSMKAPSIAIDSRNEALEAPKLGKKQSVGVREDHKKHKSEEEIHSSAKGPKVSINERRRHDKRPFEADDIKHVNEAVHAKTQKIIVRQRELPSDGKDTLKLVTKGHGQGVIFPDSSVSDRGHHVSNQDHHYTDRAHVSDRDHHIKEGKKKNKLDKISKENFFSKGSNKERSECVPGKASVGMSNNQSAGLGAFTPSTAVPIAPFTFIEDWVACDECNKWRLLPPGMHVSETSAWNCTMLYWLEHPVDCSVPEEETTRETQAQYYVKVPQLTEGQSSVNASIAGVHTNNM